MATYEKWAKVFKSRHQYLDSVPVQFGNDKDAVFQWDGTNLTLKPVTDDTGAFIVGDGTTDMDFKVFMGTTGKHVLFDQSAALVTFTAVALTLGADTAGTDLKLFGATTGNYLLWDASEDDLTLVGTATQLAVAGTTAAQSATTGSIHTAGGIGIAGALWVGTTSRLVGAVTSDAGISNTGDVASSLTMTTPSLRSASTGNVALIVNASGSGTIGIGSVSTGAVTITPATTIAGLLTLSSATGMTLTGTLTKGINFADAGLAFNQENAFIAIGTWSVPKAITAQSAHFVPIQVNLTSGTSVEADIAAARFRVDTVAAGGTANTLTAVNVLEMRSKLNVNVGSHANLQVSTEVAENITCTGDLLVGYFSLQGDGAITCGNHVNVLEATCKMSSGASGVDNVAHFTMNSTGVTATNALKVEAIAGTLTSLAHIVNTSGTVTNGLNIGGAISVGINLSTTGLHATTGRVGKFFGTVATSNQGDGYGVFEVDVTLSGTIAGTSAAFSSWVNIAASAVPGANMICAQNNGIYVPTGITASSAKMIMGMRMHYVVDDGANAGSLYLFSTNIYSNVLTALFDVNAIVDMGGSTGAQTGNDYKIPLFRDASAGQTWYVNIYHS